MLRKTLFAVALTGIAAAANAGDSVRIYADSWGGLGIDYRWSDGGWRDGGRGWHPYRGYAVPVDRHRGWAPAPRYYYAPPPRWYGYAPPRAWSPWAPRQWGYAPYRPRSDWDRDGRGGHRDDHRDGHRDHDRDGRGGGDWNHRGRRP